MKYLAKREDFLRSAKKLSQKSDFIKESKGDWRLITEEAPFENDIPWAESLIGRFIYHQIIQRIEDGTRLLRILPLTRRLRSEFDNLVSEGYLLNVDDDKKALMGKLTLHAVFEALIIHVDKGAKVEVLKNLTDESQETVKKMPDEEKEKSTLKSELDEFAKFLEGFKNNEGDGMDEEEEDGEEEDGEEEDGEEEEEIKDNKEISELILQNMKALRGILEAFPSFKSEVSRLATTTTGKHQISAGDTIQKLSAEYQIKPEVLIGMNTWLQGRKPTDSLPTKDKNGKPLTILLESVVNESSVSAFVGKVVAKIQNLLKNKGGNKDEIQTKVHDSLKSLVRHIDDLQNPKIKEVSVNLALMNTLISGKYPEKVNTIYDEIKEYVTGKKKGEVSLTQNDLLKEDNDLNFGVDKDGKKMTPQNLEANKGKILDKDSSQLIEIDGKNVYVTNIAFKIARFFKFIIQFEKAGLIDVLDTLQANTELFIKTGRQITGMVNEKRLLGFDGFMRIYEADEQKPEEDKGAPTEEQGTTSERIKDFFEQKCKTVKSYVLEKTEVEKIVANFESIEKEGKGLVINGIDPIMQICRLFNRAYKLYMREKISQRQGGEIGATIAGRYTSYGGDKSGPFRINKVFNQWEDAVLKIMGDRKYEYIFSKNTKMRFPLVPDPKNEEDWEIRKGAGLALNNFMNELIDGDSLYKTSSTDRGAQAKFIEKYFGKVGEADLEKSGGLTIGDDGESNTKIATAVENGSVKLSFTKLNEKPNFKANTFFAIKYKNIKEGKIEGDSKYYYVWTLTDAKSIAFSGTFKYFDELIQSSPLSDPESEIVDSRKKVIDKGALPKITKDTIYSKVDGTTDHWQTNYARTTKDLGDLFLRGSKLNIKYIDGRDKRKTYDKSIFVEDIYSINTVSDKPEQFVPKITTEWLKKQKIASSSDKSPFSKDPSQHLTERNTDITKV